jgi:tryptophan-rich sensory protein
LFVLLAVGGGLVIGAFNVPGGWYASLEKPPFNPPGWVFGPVWTALYVLIGIAGWRTWRRDRSGWPMRLWWTQLVLNFAWSPVFFTLHQIGAALAIVLALFAAIVAFIVTARKLDRTAAWLFVPYAAWVAFASLLNGSILALN